MPSRLREQVEHFYTLTDRLQVQLRVLEESQVAVRQSARLVRAADAVGDDVDGVAFVVRIEASRPAQDDLSEILEQARKLNAAEGKLNDSRNAATAKTSLDVESVLQLMLAVYAKSIETELETMQGRLDSLSELGEEESLRLQVAMDRLSKMMSTLSNILKKSSDVANAIVQNLK